MYRGSESAVGVESGRNRSLLGFSSLSLMGEQIAVQAGSGSTANPGDYNQSPTIAPEKAQWAGALDEADKALCSDTINQINQ